MTPELLELKKKAIDEMVSYMKYGAADSEDDPEYDPDFDAGYTQKHVDRCSKIIDEFFASLQAVANRNRNAGILKAVKVTVGKLNTLNDRCDGGLIETDQREDLCALINRAAKQAGLESDQDDVTEEWREW